MSPTFLELVVVVVVVVAGGYAALRYLPGIAHYVRQAWDYSEQQIEAANEAIDKEES